MCVRVCSVANYSRKDMIIFQGKILISIFAVGSALFSFLPKKTQREIFSFSKSASSRFPDFPQCLWLSTMQSWSSLLGPYPVCFDAAVFLYLLQNARLRLSRGETFHIVHILSFFQLRTNKMPKKTKSQNFAFLSKNPRPKWQHC